MKKKRLNLFKLWGGVLVFLLLSPLHLLAHTLEVTQAVSRNVTGTVVDAATGETIIGAAIWVRETARGTATDFDGNFTIPIDNNFSVLTINFVGMEEVVVEVGARTDLGTIRMYSHDQVLQELVVVGHGVQRRESVVGAISTINPEDLIVPSSGAISNVLAGRLAGIIAVTRSGEPGQGSEFMIRGISSMGAHRQPLILVDGVERDIDLLNPEDIATFSVLRDAAATAVFGVRGANGVILITTRTGHEGPARINVRVERGMSGPTQVPRMVNSMQFARSFNNASGTEFFTPAMIEAYRTQSDPDLFPDVRWLEVLYRDWAPNTRASMNVSGGGSIARYFISGSVLDEGSIFRQAGDTPYDSSLRFRRINFRANVDVNLTPTTILNTNLSNVFSTRRRPGAPMHDAGGNNIWVVSYTTAPNAWPTRFSNGFFAGPTQGTGFNPYNMVKHSGFANDYWNDAQALVGITQDLAMITPGLRSNVRFSWDARNSGTITRSMTVQQHLAVGRDADGNLVFNETHPGQEALGYSRSLDGRRTNYLEASLHYERVFAQRHRVSGLFLYNQSQRNQLNADNAIEALRFRNQGIAARATYGFDDRYFLEVNMGYNGSENFARGHRFGFFPSVAGGWMVSNEEFWQPMLNVVDVLRFKASYGLVGNDQIGGGRRFAFDPTIETGTNYYIFGSIGQWNHGRIRMGQPANPYVGWEVARKFNVGVDFSLFRSFTLDINYFYEHREGIFLERIGLPGLVGLTDIPWANVGEMVNQGFDAAMTINRRVGQVLLSGMGNFTFAQNRVVYNDQPDWTYRHRNRVGKPWNQPFGLIAIGLFTCYDDIANSPHQTFGPVRPGDIKFLDVTGDGIIDANDEVAIGHPAFPGITYGFGLTARWRGFDASTFFQGIARTTIAMTGSTVRPFTSGNMNTSGFQEVVYHNSWTLDNPNPNATFPRMTSTNNPNNHQLSTFWQRDGSFLRLSNVEVGYSIPLARLPHYISGLRFYAAGGNLLTFSRFRYWDPERGSGDGRGYPPNRSVTVGLNINF